jgi:hypothetical protein
MKDWQAYAITFGLPFLTIALILLVALAMGWRP